MICLGYYAAFWKSCLNIGAEICVYVFFFAYASIVVADIDVLFLVDFVYDLVFFVVKKDRRSNTKSTRKRTSISATTILA
jgi:hypothetical protein